MDHEFKVGETVYHARIMPNLGICYVQVLKIISVEEKSIIGVDVVTKGAFLVAKKDFGKLLFTNQAEAKSVVEESQKTGKIRKVNKDDGED